VRSASQLDNCSAHNAKILLSWIVAEGFVDNIVIQLQFTTGTHNLASNAVPFNT
jgi:hypothetical protein